ncbi:MAG: protein kinase [Candidatus Moeniiplasma glomeromycotorum]|nr:protein kinase [Candidatus Moeniiplasma glomeromycotorum]MCE8162413.1 protein kinase [Candidatus Moeniiplasma glomeromycotorum]MCE8166339.1 protein kinase [Candidatus Moeniiplasma glomeromycotorum]MCE8166821.1 protein kinase [Candidatus Moeniiplasma glomeromycotorum]
MVNAQEWLESQKEYNTKEKRSQVNKLDISNKNLEGKLNLSDFTNLTELNCILNQLTELNFNALIHLKNLYCRNNYLTKLDFLNNLNPEKLTNLSIRNNNLPKQDLTVFSRFINLESLHVGNDEQKRIKQGIYNRFTGSLKPLKNLIKLKELNIANTDIDKGLEYLPETAKELDCSNESKTNKISEQLASCGNSIQSWMKNKKEWEKKGFSNREIGKWAKAGLEINEWNFATYCQQKGCNPSESDKIEELKILFSKEYQKAQIWLDFNYSKDERKNIKELDIGHKRLEGSLDLSDFVNLTELKCFNNQLTSLKINNCLKLKKLNCGSFAHGSNKLIALDLSGLEELEEIECYNNYLTSFNYSVLNADKLTLLDIRSNNLPEQDLTVFSRFINLEKLEIGNNNKDKINQGIYNRFQGSLEPLKNLGKLKRLDVKNTDIDSGLEHLPNSLEKSSWLYSSEEKPNSKVKNLELEKQWQERGFSWEEMHKWQAAGLKLNESILAIYLRSNDCQSEENLNLDEWRIKWKESSEKAQRWLDENYPQEERSETSSIYLNEPSLEGELDLKDFANNWRFTTYISTLVNETKLIFKNKPGSGNFPEFIKLVQAQKWLDANYPLEERFKIKLLDISNKSLEGSLNLEGFSNLEKLGCGNNLITRLEIINCPKLEEVQCQKNKLTELILQDCPNLKVICCHSNLLSNLDLSQNEKLEQLDVRSNNFAEQDLKFLSHLVNLRSLEIGNRIDKQIFKIGEGIKKIERIDLKFYNRFVGSLESLKNLTKLEKLEIIYTDLESGLENLSDGVDIWRFAKEWKEQGFEFNDQESLALIQLGFHLQKGGNELINRWRKQNFSPLTIKGWIKAGLKLGEVHLANYLREEGYNPQQLPVYLDELREKYNDTWIDIHPGFAELSGEYYYEYDDKICQVQWEERDITWKKAQELVEVGFQPKDFEVIDEWTKNDFTHQQIQEWLIVGLTKEETKLATYLQQKNLAPSQAKDNLEKLREEHNTHLLNEWYPLEERETHTSININSLDFLHGTLVIQNFPQLVEINCSSCQLTKLIIKNCPQLEEVNCCNNKLIELEISSCPNISRLICFDNQLTNLNFLNDLDPEKLTRLELNNNNITQDLTIFGKLTNLEYLYTSSNPFFGSLEPLVNCSNLYLIDVKDTDIDSGLEYLPESLQILYCTGQLAEILEPYENKEVEKNGNEEEYEDESDVSYVDLLQEWRKDNVLFTKAKARQLLKDELQVQTQQIKELKQQLVQLQLKKTTEAASQTDFTSQDWEQLQGEKNELKNKLKEKENETHAFQEKIKELQTELSKDRESYQKLVTKLDEEKNKFLDTKLTEKELQKARQNIERLEKELTEAEESLENNQEQILNLRKELLDKNREVKRVWAEKQIESDALQTEKDKLKLEFDNLKVKLESNKKELKQKKQELNETKKSLEKEKLNKSIGLTRELRRQEEKLKKEVENLKEKNEKLEKQLTKRNQQIITVDDNIKSNSFQVKPNLKRCIGKGGYGEVHYGEWKLQDVAVKKLYLLPISQNDIKEINNEISILKNLRNRYIIQYYGTYSDNQELLIIMDYAEKGTLTKFINDNRNKEQDWNLNNGLINQIALGLAYIHSEGIIHRDLKSLNILLTNNYQQVKISDFGLSKVKSITSSQSKGDTKGTLGWMAPELLKGEKYSEQSDIYALGMIIWEIAAKCTAPFKDTEYNLVGFHIINGGRETIPNDAPENIQEIIRQCWKDAPNERINLEKIIENIRSPQPIDTNHSLEKQSLEVVEQPPSNSEFGLNINDFDLDELDQEKLKTSNSQSRSWENVSPNLTPNLTEFWTNLNFTYQQTRDWINAGLQPIDYDFCAWLRDIKEVNAEWVLNHANEVELRQEYQFYKQLQTQVEQPPK